VHMRQDIIVKKSWPCSTI